MAVSMGDVAETVSPEDLVHRRRLGVPALRTLDEVRPALEQTGLQWGPTGSVGFELATGVPTATEDSDLDLLVRLPRLTPEVLASLAALHELFGQQSARIDCQVETFYGAAALAEVMAGRPDILMKTGAGPTLVSRAVALS